MIKKKCCVLLEESFTRKKVVTLITSLGIFEIINDHQVADILIVEQSYREESIRKVPIVKICVKNELYIAQLHYGGGIVFSGSFSFEDVITAFNYAGDLNLSPFFFIRSANKTEKVFLQDVLYVEGLNNYAVIHTRKRKYVTYLTLGSIERQFPARQFIRIHKSYLVAIDKIDAISKTTVYVEDRQLTAAKSYRPELLKRIDGWLIKRDTAIHTRQ